MGKKSLLKATGGGNGGSTSDEKLVAMALDRLKPNPWNTKSKSRYSGPEFDELVASIEAKGLVQPILIRPVKKQKKVDHEIVCGERRYRAKLVIAGKNGGPGKNTILSIVRELTDEEAFDLTIIENLQRQDLNPLDEAEQFKAFLDLHGDDAAADLADRIGVSTAYVRRRVAVLALPRPALKAWRRGQMSYGHLEQLRRLRDKKQIARFVAQIVERSQQDGYRQAITVRELKHDIDMESPDLAETIFDKKKAGCVRCASNSNVQRKLFETKEDEKIKCLNPRCFKQNVNNHLTKKWEEKYNPQWGTNGFRFESSLNWNDYQTIHDGRIRKVCKQCDKFLTLVYANGAVYQKQICMGSKNCYDETFNKKGVSGTAADPVEKAERRAKNHGEEFRELFYEDALPDRFKSLAAEDEKVIQCIIISYYVASGWETGQWMAEQLQVKRDEYDSYESGDIYDAILDMPKDRARAFLQKLALYSIMNRGFPATRRAVADHIGINLAAEWSITEAYLKKKTIAEILSIGNALGIFDDPIVQLYAFEHYPKCDYEDLEGGEKVHKVDYTKLKKSELVKVILESGINLVGKVPGEIIG